MDLNQSSLLLESKRLRLVPMTYDFISKIMENDSSAYALLGAVKTETWPETADIKDILPMLRVDLRNKPNPDGYDVWLFMNKEDGTIVGDGGFKGVPDENGIIDMGYAILESQRQKGYALEAATALLEWGLSQDRVNAVTADCLDDNIPSIKILSKIGMREVE